MPDGNAAQIRMVAESVVDATMALSRLMTEEFARLEKHLDDRIKWAITTSERARSSTLRYSRHRSQH